MMVTDSKIVGDQLQSDLKLAKAGMSELEGARVHLKDLSTLLSEFRRTVRNAQKTNDQGQYDGLSHDALLFTLRKGLNESREGIEQWSKKEN